MQSNPLKENVELVHSHTHLGNAQPVMISVRHVAQKANGQPVEENKSEEGHSNIHTWRMKKLIQFKVVMTVLQPYLIQ